MATCKECGKQMGFFEGDRGLCSDCFSKTLAGNAELARQRAQELDRTAADEDAAIAAVLLTTETAPDLYIIRRVEIVTAECAFGMHIFKDLFAGIRDFVGGRSKAVQNTLRDARRTALHELKREAHLVGANAVVGVDLDYMELSAAGTMVLLVASGTAVVIDSEHPQPHA
jgi:uncharacterized protein YbjQ (UPF0145 family)